MSIAVACACGAKLKAPDTAAGKRVKCPKCGDPIAVPAAEVEYEMVEDAPPPTPARKKPQLIEDDDEPPAKTKAKGKPVEVDEAVDDEEEDEKPGKKSRRARDEDEDDAPRKKAGKRKKGKNREEEKKKRMITLIVGLCGAAVVLGAAATVAYFALNMSDPAKVTAPTKPAPPPLPAGWSTFKGEGFSVAVPDDIQFKRQDLPPNAGGAGGAQAAGAKVYTNGAQPQPGQPAWVYVVNVGVPTDAELAEFNQDPEKVWEKLKQQAAAGGGKVDKMTPITVAGVQGRELTMTNTLLGLSGIARVVVKDNRVYSWAVLAPTAPTADSPKVKPFFDTFAIE